MDMIWWDNQCYNGRGAKSEYATEEVNLGPENKRPIPCDQGCVQRARCAAQALECSAFRNWATKGDWKNLEVAVRIRAA